MGLKQIQKDYENELKVLQLWSKKMDGSAPPEGKMSKEYRDGWKIFLAAVTQISYRMITICKTGDAKLLAKTLDDEQKKYNALAAQATKVGLLELGDMLRWEATSRVELIQDLSARQ